MKDNDITKCRGEDCPIRHSCYRYMVPDSQFQSYFVETPCEQCENEGEIFSCSHFLRAEDSKNKIVQKHSRKFKTGNI